VREIRIYTPLVLNCHNWGFWISGVDLVRLLPLEPLFSPVPRLVCLPTGADRRTRRGPWHRQAQNPTFRRRLWHCMSPAAKLRACPTPRSISGSLEPTGGAYYALSSSSFILTVRLLLRWRPSTPSGAVSPRYPWVNQCMWASISTGYPRRRRTRRRRTRRRRTRRRRTRRRSTPESKCCMKDMMERGDADNRNPGPLGYPTNKSNKVAIHGRVQGLRLVIYTKSFGTHSTSHSCYHI